MDKARANLRSDFLRRWWCKKYRLPPTDDRYLAYTFEDLVTEFVEDAIESGRFDGGTDGEAIEVEYLPDGTPIYKTGDPEIDRLEQEFAGEILSEIEEEKRKGIRHTLSPPPKEEKRSPMVDSSEELLEALFGDR